MAQQEETLDPLNSSSVSVDPSTSDPSLSRNTSFSRLNAKAPEFVPSRAPPVPPPQPHQQQSRIAIPTPPPPGMLHMYHPPPFHVPGQGPVHLVPVVPNHPHHHPRNHRQVNQQYVPVRNHNQQQNQQFYGGSSGGVGEQEFEMHLKKSGGGLDHDRKKDHKKDHGEGSGGGCSDSKNVSKNGLSDESAQKSLNQVEYYFSDLNLATTDHLMRFISKDPEGYVPISVVASFKKIKASINSNSQLANILRNSSKLVVSEDGKKVKRQQPITESDIEELQSRVVVAENLPEDHCHQNLMKIFSTVGSVKTIRTCQPQISGNGASSASRPGKADGMLSSNKVHAFVEYETIEMAERAVAELNAEGSWRSGLRLRLMLKRSPKDAKLAQGRNKKGHDAEGHFEEEDASTSEKQLNEKPSEDFSQETDVPIHEHRVEEVANDKEGGQKKGRSRGRAKGRGRGQYGNSSNSNNNNNNHRGAHVGTPPSNTLVTNEHPMITKQPPGPRMPDGTRGFSMGRGKPIAVVNTA